MGQQYVQIYTLPFTNEEYFLFLYILFLRTWDSSPQLWYPRVKNWNTKNFFPFINIMENLITIYGKKYTDTVEMNPQTRR